MKTNEASAGNGISVILVLFGCVILFSTEIVWIAVVGALLTAIGLWGLIR